MTWRVTDSLDAFVAAAGDHLRCDPVEHTVPLTVLETLREAGPNAFGDSPPVFGWHEAADGAIEGAFFQTPPFPVLIASLPPGSADSLVELVAGRAARAVADRLSHDGLMLRETGGVPVAMAGVTREVAGVVRVLSVYTPPAYRRRGYGGAVTTAVSRAALTAGAVAVLLFTDLANPISNALYQRLGYRPMGDRVELSLTPGKGHRSDVTGALGAPSETS